MESYITSYKTGNVSHHKSPEMLRVTKGNK